MEGLCKEIQSIQLETTSRCELNCLTCLKPAYKNTWQERDMEQDLFDHILAQLPPTASVHLQGWGEPLLHRDTLTQVEKLKSLGLTVSFTTSGTVMEGRLAERLVALGLDGLTFSMAGNCPRTHDLLRGKGSFSLMQGSIRTFLKAKENSNTQLPHVVVSYLLTPDSVAELPRAVSWCRRNGVDGFATVHLTQAGCTQQQKLQFMFSKKQAGRYAVLRMRAHFHTLFSAMQLHLREFYPTLTAMCDKRPLTSVFINAVGDVSPCVFLNPPVSGAVTWHHERRRQSRSPLIFGNLRKRSLSEIWYGSAYRDFRRKFRERQDYHDKKLAGIGCSFTGSTELESAVKSIQQYFFEHPVPEQCRACAKADGF